VQLGQGREALVVLLVGLCLTAVASGLVRQAVRAKERERFGNLVATTQEAIERRMDAYGGARWRRGSTRTW
jgi:CHASE1-domain containing sensor protein